MFCYSNELVNFIYILQFFIVDYNDIFNDQVIVFMVIVVSKVIYECMVGVFYYWECYDLVWKNFLFGKCFDFYYFKVMVMYWWL